MTTFSEGLEKLRLIRSLPDNNNNEPILTVRSANEWVEQAKQRPIPQMLFSEFWHEGELCILFADTNLGKSILAVQIGDSISKGLAVCGFKLQAPKQKVLYLDFELSDKQFEARYSTDFKDHYRFDQLFLRAEINSEGSGENLEERISKELESIVENTGAKILIIDNLTYLRCDTEKAKDALPLMKQLKGLKKKHNLSILCLAHTPKRDLTKPITRNDLQGSKMLINFCDSSFSVGESQQDKHVRYLKQIKARNTEIKYSSDDVILCQINKRNSFLGFEFVGFGNELDHLKTPSDQDRANRINEALELKKKGLNNVEIANRCGVSETAVRKWLKKSEPDPSTALELEPSSRGSSVEEICPF
jgi:RecA-family ATPase